MEVVAKANHVSAMDQEMKPETEQFSPDPMKMWSSGTHRLSTASLVLFVVMFFFLY
jgi:hypothetical protein